MSEKRPLADEIRPLTLDEVVGQKHLLGKGALAGADLIRQGGVQLLIQRRFLVGIQLYHSSPPHWPHKKFKN